MFLLSSDNTNLAPKVGDVNEGLRFEPNDEKNRRPGGVSGRPFLQKLLFNMHQGGRHMVKVLLCAAQFSAAMMLYLIFQNTPVLRLSCTSASPMGSVSRPRTSPSAASRYSW